MKLAEREAEQYLDEHPVIEVWSDDHAEWHGRPRSNSVIGAFRPNGKGSFQPDMRDEPTLWRAGPGVVQDVKQRSDELDGRWPA